MTLSSLLVVLGGSLMSSVTAAMGSVGVVVLVVAATAVVVSNWELQKQGRPDANCHYQHVWYNVPPGSITFSSRRGVVFGPTSSWRLKFHHPRGITFFRNAAYHVAFVSEGGLNITRVLKFGFGTWFFRGR